MAGLSLVPDVTQLRFSLLDEVGIALFFGAAVVYHSFYALWTQLHPLATVKGKVALYRRTWVKRIVDRDEQLLA
ncbi:MAG: DUF599 domain-containing protein, partial [Halobacteriales archaeon]|nr:DUF599 domain-containing protein [Halobacteriales archaeon]